MRFAISLINFQMSWFIISDSSSLSNALKMMGKLKRLWQSTENFKHWKWLLALKSIKMLQIWGIWKIIACLISSNNCGFLSIPTNTALVFHVETTWKRLFSSRKRLFSSRFNVEYTWCVCREFVSYLLLWNKKNERKKIFK